MPSLIDTVRSLSDRNRNLEARVAELEAAYRPEACARVQAECDRRGGALAEILRAAARGGDPDALRAIVGIAQRALAPQ